MGVQAFLMQTSPHGAAFLPTFEKFGKTVQVLLGQEEIHFVQSSLNTDGPHVISRFRMVRAPWDLDWAAERGSRMAGGIVKLAMIICRRL